MKKGHEKCPFSISFRFFRRKARAARALTVGAAGAARTSCTASGAFPSAHSANLASHNKKDDDCKYGNNNDIGHMVGFPF